MYDIDFKYETRKVSFLKYQASVKILYKKLDTEGWELWCTWPVNLKYIPINSLLCFSEALDEFTGQPVKGNPFVMPVFNNTEAGRPPATLGQQLTPVSSCPMLSVGAVATQSSMLMFQPVNISPKSAARRSPMLWPKRNSNMISNNDPGPPLVEWPPALPVTKEEFCKLHEDFGKEVKVLIADWSKKQRPEAVAEENLIDFGWSQRNTNGIDM